MLRAGTLQRKLQLPQDFPAVLLVHRTPEVRGHPGRHLRPRPRATLRRGSLHRLRQRRQARGRQEWRGTRIGVALVTKGLWPLLVITTHERAHPRHGVACHGRYVGRGLALSKQPDNLPMTTGDSVARLPVALRKRSDRHMRNKRQTFWHTASIHPDYVLLVKLCTTWVRKWRWMGFSRHTGATKRDRCSGEGCLSGQHLC